MSPTIIVLAAIVGAVAVGWFLYGRTRRAIAAPSHRPLPPGRAEAAKKDEAIFDPRPNQISPGDDIQLERKSDHGPVTFSVKAAATIRDAEDEDDEWSEFEILALEGDARYWLVYAEDDEDRWTWTLHRKVPQAELDALPVFDKMGYDGKKPPKELEVFGKAWKVERGSRHYDVLVTDWRVDRQQQQTYEARMTDYREVGGTARMGVELWEDGIAVSLAEESIDNITVIKRAVATW